MYDDILYTPEEIAEKLKISKYTVYEMIKRGDISAHKIGRNLRISDTQLEMYFAKTNSLNNTYTANVIEENKKVYAEIESVRIYVNTELRNAVKILIRPEDIILSLDIFPNSARNILKGVITDIKMDGNSVKVFVDTGINLISLITKDSLNDLQLKVGSEVYTIFKTMAVRVFK